MYEKAVKKDLNMLFNVLDQYRTREICQRAEEKSEHALKHVPE